MSFDEFLVLAISGVYSVWAWNKWYSAVFEVWPFERGRNSRIWLAVLPLLCMAGIYIILRTVASFDVVGDRLYIFFYLVIGSAWLAAGKELMFMYLDLSWRDDAIEANNPAAVMAVSGGLVGLTAMYAGANIGDGPGWWCVIFAGGLAIVAWFVILRVMDAWTNAFHKITVERSPVVGIRMGMFMAASGIILGRGAAGDWTSLGYTIIEFFDAWPVLFLAIIVAFIEWQSSKSQFSYSAGSTFIGALLLGFFYVVFAITLVMVLPSLPQNPLY